MKLWGSVNEKISKKLKVVIFVSPLEITEVVLIHCILVILPIKVIQEFCVDSYGRNCLHSCF